MIKSLYETKVDQMKEFFHSHKDQVLDYEVTHGWVEKKKSVKVLGVYDTHVRLGVVDKKGIVLYPECVNYAAMLKKSEYIFNLQTV